MKYWLVMVNVFSVPNVVLVMSHVFELMAEDVMFKVTLEVMFRMFVRFLMVWYFKVIVVYWFMRDFMVWYIVVVVMYWFMLDFMVWHIVIVVMYWRKMTFLVVSISVLIGVESRVDSVIHIVVRALYRVVMISMYWLDHNSLVVCIWIRIVVSLVVNWMLQMHLFVVDWVGVVVLHRCDDINKVDLSNVPLMRVFFLMVFMHSLRDVMVV